MAFLISLYLLGALIWSLGFTEYSNTESAKYAQP